MPPEPGCPKALPADSSPETSTPPAPGCDTRVVVLQGLLRGEWELFAERCRTNENKGAEEKIMELILRYIRG